MKMVICRTALAQWISLIAITFISIGAMLILVKEFNVHQNRQSPEGKSQEEPRDYPDNQFNRASESDVNSSSSDLIVRYLHSRELPILTTAQKQYPNNEDVIFASAYAAEHPDSQWLKKMQQIMPNNGLPNLIAASLYLENGEVEKFKDELRIAVTKVDIATNLRKQRADLMDALLSGEIEPNSELYPSITERQMLKRFSVIAAALGRNPAILGESNEDLELGLMFANKLRGIRDNSFTFEWQASVLEADILRNLDKSVIYNSTGVTVGERRRELYTKFNQDAKKIDAIEIAIGKNSLNVTLRIQFFARLRADGEAQAINWLMKETSKSTIN